MSGFLLPLHTVAAHLLLTVGKPRPGEIFLSERVAHHDGPETTLEMLNRPEAFFPFKGEEAGVMLVAKARTVMLAVNQHAPEIVDAQRRSVAKAVGLVVVLADGSKIEGRALVELPQYNARLLDYLNAPEPFFALATEHGTNYVNRSHVLYARPME